MIPSLFAEVLPFFLDLELFSLSGFIEPAGHNKLHNLPEFVAIKPGPVRFAPIDYYAGALELPPVHQLFAFGARNINPPGLGFRCFYCKHPLRIESDDCLLLFLIRTDLLQGVVVHP